MLLRRSPVPVTYATPGGLTHQVTRGTGGETGGSTGSGVVITGEPVELALYSYGRGAQARVELDGEPQAIERFKTVRLAL